MEAIALTAKPIWKPDVALPVNPRDFKTPNYGLLTFADLFTPRQLVALTTFSGLVQEARELMKRDAITAGLPDDSKPLRDGGTGGKSYILKITYAAANTAGAGDEWLEAGDYTDTVTFTVTAL